MSTKNVMCWTCLFYDPWNDDHGICRHDPPRIMADRQGGNRWGAGWPSVRNEDWCRLHTPRDVRQGSNGGTCEARGAATGPAKTGDSPNGEGKRE